VTTGGRFSAEERDALVRLHESCLRLREALEGVLGEDLHEEARRRVAANLWAVSACCRLLDGLRRGDPAKGGTEDGD
jgi:hypothetical protein